MPDITMCNNNKCLSKNKCYRFIATPSRYQSYIAWTVKEKVNKCEYFWEV